MPYRMVGYRLARFVFACAVLVGVIAIDITMLIPLARSSFEAIQTQDLPMGRYLLLIAKQFGMVYGPFILAAIWAIWELVIFLHYHREYERMQETRRRAELPPQPPLETPSGTQPPPDRPS